MKYAKQLLRKHFPKVHGLLTNCRHKTREIRHKWRSARAFAQVPVAETKGEVQLHYSSYPELDPRVTNLGFLGVFGPALQPPTAALSKGCDPGHVVMLVVSALRIDPRVEREARALASNGFRVTVICPDISSPPLLEQPIEWGANVEFDILGWQAASFINQYPWMHGDLMLEAALKYRPLAFHCHDLSTALIGLAAARSVGARCVCDFHEWYSENVSWDSVKLAYVPHPESTRTLYQAAEALAMARADEVITVCDSIARELQSSYPVGGKSVHVIRNVPSLKRSDVVYPSLRDSLQVKSDQVVLLWQGGTGPTRLLEPVIKALALAPKIVFVIRGPSLDLFGEGYRKLAEEVGAGNRLHLLPPVKSADVVAAANGADIGIWTLPNLSKNFYYALPNKIFEYLAADLPLICANFPEARAIVEGYDVGVTFDPYDPKSIADAMNKMTDQAFRSACASNVGIALTELQADREWDKLVALYGGLRERTQVA